MLFLSQAVCYITCYAPVTHEKQYYEMQSAADLCSFPAWQSLQWCSGMADCARFCSKGMDLAQKQCGQFDYPPSSRSLPTGKGRYPLDVIIKFNLYNIKCARDVDI